MAVFRRGDVVKTKWYHPQVGISGTQGVILKGVNGFSSMVRIRNHQTRWGVLATHDIIIPHRYLEYIYLPESEDG